METGIIILLAALALGVILFAAGYLKAPPDTAFIISGLGKKRILIGKAGWRIPFLERVDKLSLQVMTVDVKTSEAVPTNEFINVMVDGLLQAGVSPDFLYRLGLEYRFISQYLLGQFATQEDMLEALSRAIKRFAKRQMTWFRRDTRIHWLDMRADPLSEAQGLCAQFLAE